MCLAGKFCHEMNEMFQSGGCHFGIFQLVCQRNGGHWSWAGQSRGCDTSSGWVRAPRGVGVRSYLHLQPTLSSEGACIHPPAVYQLPGGGRHLSLHMSNLNSTPSSPDLVLVQCSQSLWITSILHSVMQARVWESLLPPPFAKSC